MKPLKKTDIGFADTIRDARGRPTGLREIGAGWGGEMPVVKKAKPVVPVNKPIAPLPKPAIKPMSSVTPRTKFKMNKKGVISKIK